ncbi:uncharacterized protein KY384_006352 [Bacidia gigantensis]|uniref:uncharacterized protein n=1 Tax=Bacidia gigantensis TaxID=2732470 RepID=UPI001D04D3CE|nr:uncharacterized protein KY384_006352 [Bacidia gigantensis]KAG8528665.1 hypothetical protein KY384_006352 [Bacidia gigantensis]
MLLGSSSLYRLLLLLTIGYITYLHLSFTKITSPQPVPAQDESSKLSTPGARIPQKIWQTSPSTIPALNASHASRIQTWTSLNPSWRYECLSDQAAESWVRSTFTATSPEPDLVSLSWLGDIYLSLTDRILRADFLRYLLVYAEGGVYTDLDTSCLVPIKQWAGVNATLMEQAEVVIGVEADRKPVENDWRLYQDYRDWIWGVENWTFGAKARHPLFKAVLENVGKKLQDLLKSPEGDKAVLYHEVIATTGPRAFSEAFLEYISSTQEKQISYKEFSMLEQPKLVGGVLVLPIRAMSVMEADRADGEGARSLGLEPVVRHWSEGSWKGSHIAVLGDKPDGWKEREEKLSTEEAKAKKERKAEKKIVKKEKAERRKEKKDRREKKMDKKMDKKMAKQLKAVMRGE